MAQIFRRFWFLIRRRQIQQELAEEMAFHREQVAAEHRADGMAPGAAEQAAKRQVGNEELLLDRSTEAVSFRWESVTQDVRFAARQLKKNPGFACTAILTLALGLGASISIFSFVDATLIRPLPYKDPAHLMHVTERVASIPSANLSYLDYLDWTKQNQVFSSFDVWAGSGYLLSTSSGSEVVPAVRVSSGIFRTLGVEPMLGRDFYPGEDQPGAANTVILSYAAWQKHFSGASDVVGKSVILSGVVYTIVGVLPKSFEFAPRGNAEFWAPLRGDKECELRRSCHNLNGVGRLKDGVSERTARANMAAIAAQLEAQYPDSNRGQGALVEPFSEFIVGNIRPMLFVLLAGAGLLLLIACVNVSSLLLVRFESRRREIAVRGALGASSVRLVRLFITESLLLAIGATLMALALATTGIHILLRLISKEIMPYVPYLLDVGLNRHTLTFAGAIALMACVLFSIAPALRIASAREFRNDLNEGGRTSAGTFWRRLGSNLVVAELALAVILLACAGLLGKSLNRLLGVDVGFNSDHLATVQVAAPSELFPKEDDPVAIQKQIIAVANTVPGVQSAGVTSMLPVENNGNTTWIRIIGHPYHGEHNEVLERDISASYIHTLKASLLRGRMFTDVEDASKPGVVIINQAFANKFFPGEDPIGKTMGDTALTPASICSIIGIVNDIHEGALDAEVWPAVYYPFNQHSDHFFAVIVRTSQPEATVLPTLISAIHRVNPNLGTADIATMQERIDGSTAAYIHRSAAWLIGGFSALALLLGVAGLYSVVAYSVSQRTREIGVRMALGAQRASVYELVMKQSGRLVASGVVVGLAASVLCGTFMRNLLFGIRAWDVPTLLGVAVLLAAAALVATFMPAHRAATVNPVDALRAE